MGSNFHGGFRDLTDIKSRVSKAQHIETPLFKWSKVLKWIVVASALIGSYVTALAAIVIKEISRGSIVIFHPSDTYIVVSAFLMLCGVVLLSIQLVSVINFLMHGHAPPDH